MVKIPFSDGTKVSSAKVTIDEVDYPVTPARYTGATPLSSLVMNTMQTNIENAINQNADNIGGEDYDSTATYEEGDIVKYEGQLYICIEAIDTPEEWDSTKWNATDVLSSAGGNEIAIGTNADITGKTKLFVEESTQTLKYKSSTTGQFENLTSEDIVIGEPEDVTPETKIFIDESEGTDAYSEVVNSLAGNEIAKAPSVRAVNEALLDVYSTDEVRIGTWIDGKPLYRKCFSISITNQTNATIGVLQNIDFISITDKSTTYFIGGTNTYYVPVSTYEASTNFSKFFVSKNNSNNTASIVWMGNATTGTVIAVVEYTKTSD